MPQGLSAHRPTAYPARREAPRKGDWPRAPAPASARPRTRPAHHGHLSPPGTAPPELQQHRGQPAAEEPAPPLSQPHHERAGRRPYRRIEAVAATIEAKWAEQVGAPRLEELRTTLSDLLTHRQGQPVRQRP